MKKVLFGLLLTVLFVPMMVFAAQVPYVWIVNGEEISASGSSNADGTATITKDGNVVTLTLKDYNGGPLKEECRGTGVPEVEFKIVLEGNNTITADNIGIELDAEGKEIVFEGKGTLTIEAPKPLSYADLESLTFIEPSIKETEEKDDNLLISENEKEDDLLISENEELTSPKKEKTKYIIPIAIGVAVLIIVCVVGILLSKRNKKIEEKPQ